MINPKYDFSVPGQRLYKWLFTFCFFVLLSTNAIPLAASEADSETQSQNGSEKSKTGEKAAQESPGFFFSDTSFYQDFEAQRSKTIDRSKEAADRSQVQVSKRLHSFSAYVDKFFVDESYVQESKDSRLRISLVNFYQKYERPSLRPRMSLSLALPNTKDKWRLSLLSEDDLDQEQSQSADGESNVNQNSSLITALGVKLKEEELVNISFDAGIKFRTPIDPFTRFRMRRSFKGEKIETRITETLQWRDSEGKSASTLLELEYPFSINYFFRSRSEIIYWDRNSYWSGSQSFTFFDQLTPKSIIAYAIGVKFQDENETHTRKKDQVNEVWLETRYRKNFYKDWLFYQISPGFTHTREYHFETLPRLELKLEALYGK